MEDSRETHDKTPLLVRGFWAPGISSAQLVGVSTSNGAGELSRLQSRFDSQSVMSSCRRRIDAKLAKARLDLVQEEQRLKMEYELKKLESERVLFHAKAEAVEADIIAEAPLESIEDILVFDELASPLPASKKAGFYLQGKPVSSYLAKEADHIGMSEAQSDVSAPQSTSIFHGPAVASSPPCLLGSVPVPSDFSVVAPHAQHSSGVLSSGPAVTPSPHCSLGSISPGLPTVASHIWCLAPGLQ